MDEICGCCLEPKEPGKPCPHCGREGIQNAPHQLPVGTVLQGHYVIGRALGQGGFGITYLALDQNLDMTVAVKEYFPSSFAGRGQGLQVTATMDGDSFQSGLRRFCKEAKLLAKMSRIPEIVHVYNFFEANGTAYMVMEYLQGQDLRAYMDRLGRTMTPEETLVLLKPILRALNQVHEIGLVHRDISPDNIMLIEGGSVKLLDFGIAKDLSGEGTKSASVALKHGYAPPEQYRTDGNIGPWTDEYALCGTAWYCMTGTIPPEAMVRMMDGTGPNWAGISGMQPRWAAALEKAMDLKPENRFATLGGLGQALEAPASKLTPPIPVEPRTPERRGEKREKQNGKWVAAAIAAVLVLLAVIFILGREKNAGVPKPAPESTAPAMAETTESAGIYIPGIYEAVGTGINGDVKVTMTFSDSEITDVVVDASNELQAIGGVAAAALQEAMLKEKRADVDAVSGATITSEAVISAAKKCVEQAKR